MSAIAVSNTVDKIHAEKRESTYMTIAKKYERKELDAFAEMLALFVAVMDSNPEQDFLGELYMSLQLGNDHAGQFFTPYNICKMTAALSVGDCIQDMVKRQGWISVSDPASGAGALLLAFANECRNKQKINFQNKVLFIAQDIDYTVGMMCYLQLSIMGCPGYVVIGNTLTNPSTCFDDRGLIPKDEGNVWYTPFYFTNIWQIRCLSAHMGIAFNGNDRMKEQGVPQKKIVSKRKPKPKEPDTVLESDEGQLMLF